MNPRAWRLSTVHAWIADRGAIVAPYDDDRPEEAIFVRTLGALMPSTLPALPAPDAEIEAAVLAYVRAAPRWPPPETWEIADALERHDEREVRAAVRRMLADGRLIRAGRAGVKAGK